MKILRESMDAVEVVVEIEDTIIILNQLQVDMQSCDLMTQKTWRSFETLKNELRGVEASIIVDE
jgi:hypothetical protein